MIEGVEAGRIAVRDLLPRLQGRQTLIHRFRPDAGEKLHATAHVQHCHSLCT
jgi:hypothetical protein